MWGRHEASCGVQKQVRQVRMRLVNPFAEGDTESRAWGYGTPAPTCSVQTCSCPIVGYRGAEVHSCINIYNFWIQFCDKFLPLKSDLHKTTRQIDGTISFVIFPKCFVIFSKCCLRVLFVACRTAIDSPKKAGAALHLSQGCSGAMQIYNMFLRKPNRPLFR